MPCYDPPLSKEERRKYGYYNEADLIQMLCLLMREGGEALITPAGLRGEDKEIATETLKWWRKHQELDNNRKRK